MFSKKNNAKASKTMTVIAEGVKVEGQIHCPGSARIDGNLKGSIAIGKELVIGKEGKVEADVKTNDATVAGEFIGEMVASGEVIITATGKFNGNLTQKDAMLTVSKGGIFKGESIISDKKEVFQKETVGSKNSSKDTNNNY